MPDIPLGTGLEKIRARRRLSMEIILIALALAVFVNVFSTCLLNVIEPACANYSFWFRGTLVSGVILLIATGGAILLLFCRKETEIADFSITLPIYVDKSQNVVTFVEHKNYQPAKYAHELFPRIEKDLKDQFAEAWPGPKPIANSEFMPGHHCWDTIEQLVQAFIILLVQKYGISSLTHSAQFYSEFRQLAGRIPAKRLQREEWPASIQSNIFLKARGLQKLIVPESTTFSTSVPNHVPGRKPGTRELTIKAAQCSLTFSISPYWTVLRDYDRAKIHFSLQQVDNVCFLRVPIDMRLSSRGLYFSDGRIHFSYQKISCLYLWLQKLAENAHRRMDWGLYLRRQGGFFDDF